MDTPEAQNIDEKEVQYDTAELKAELKDVVDEQPLTVDENEAMDRLWTLLETLAGEDSHTEIKAGDGQIHSVPTVLPARRQIRVLKRIRALMDMSTSLSSGMAMVDKSPLSILSAIIDAFDDDEKIFDLLDEAMVEAFGADQRRRGTGALAEVLAENKATDLFPIEEIGRAIAPFVARLLLQLGAAAKPVLAALTKL